MPSIIPLRYRRVLGDPRVLAVLGIILLVGVPVYLFGFRWQPERQVEAKWEGFLDAVEHRSWKRARGYLAEDYLDAWGQDRERAVDNAAEVLQGFLSLEIERQGMVLAMSPEDGTAVVSAVLVLQGKPTTYPSQAALGESRDLLAPWEFRLVKAGAWPWAWKIQWIGNEDLQISEAQIRQMEETIQEFRGEE